MVVWCQQKKKLRKCVAGEWLHVNHWLVALIIFTFGRKAKARMSKDDDESTMEQPRPRETVMKHKIDQNGHFLPFHGVTIVHKVIQDSSSDTNDGEHAEISTSLVFLANVERFLRQSALLSTYYAPLPSSSYHMTLYSVQNAHEQTLTQWRHYIQQHTDRWCQLHSLLGQPLAAHFQPRVLVTKLYHQGSIGLEVALSSQDVQTATQIRQDCVDVMMMPSDERRRVREKARPSHTFHVTLAYQTRAIPIEHQWAVQLEIARLMTECTDTMMATTRTTDDKDNTSNTSTSNKPHDNATTPTSLFLNLGPPQLCAFSDMTAFPEWTDPAKGWPYLSGTG